MATRYADAESAATGECIIEATVPTGFETVAAAEVKELIKTECTFVRGKITFPTPVRKVKDILQLGGVDHCRVRILHVSTFGFSSDPEECLSRLQGLVEDCQWREGLDVWSRLQPFSDPHCVHPLPDDQDPSHVCHSTLMPAHGSSRVNEHSSEEQNSNHPEHDRSDFVLHSDKQHGRHSQTDISDSVLHSVLFDSSGMVDTGDAELLSCRHGNSTSARSADRRLEMELAATSQHRNPEWLGSHVTPGKLCTGTRTAQDAVHTTSQFCSDHFSQKVCDSYANSTEATTQRKEWFTKRIEDRKYGQSRIITTTRPKFRVTCHRTGQNHCFDSMSAAASFGHAVQKSFGWEVDMTKFDVEVVLRVDGEEVSVSVALTPDSLHRRDMVAFGVTTLRPTIACNMLRMLDIQAGHVVCDPLCGTSSIPIQGALRFDPSFQLCGDNHRVAMEKTLCNIDALNTMRAACGRGMLMINAVRWNACSLPLRDGVVDAFVSDLPFGKRVGRRSDNQRLYTGALQEMARCSTPRGRAALLTADVKNMTKALKAQRQWSMLRRCGCNIGGLAAAVFLMQRASLTSCIGA